MEKNLRSEDIGAAEIFAVSNSKDMNELLGVVLLLDAYNEVIYYNIVKRHKTIQEDRAQSSGAVERAMEALKNMDKPQARDEMYDKQCEFFRAYCELVLQSFISSEGAQTPLSADAVNKVLQGSLDCIDQLAEQEEDRFVNDVTIVCLDKYKKLEERWHLLENLPVPAKIINVQPIANTSFGLKRTGVVCEASPLELTGCA